jgi:hypothetical protein
VNDAGEGYKFPVLSRNYGRLASVFFSVDVKKVIHSFGWLADSLESKKADLVGFL